MTMSRATLLAGNALKSIKTHFPPKKLVNIRESFVPVRYFSITQSRNMKLVQFSYPDTPSVTNVGYVGNDNKIVDVNKLDPSLPRTLLEILRNGQLDKLKVLQRTNPEGVISVSSALLKAPITGMDKVLCIGLNYNDHCVEQSLTPPKVPMIFSKFASSVVGQAEPLRLRTKVTQKVDWEAELCIVIGKEASDVSASDALKYLLGATVAQDISARDWQKEKNAGQFLLGKSMDTFCPIGPWITTLDDIQNLEDLNIKCSINGAEKQNSNTCQLVHKIPDLIERISSVMTLLPGDIILTGTPGGVGMHRTPPEYLKAGDVILTEVQSIGVLETKCIEF